jgi:hypothetical protein
MPQEAAILSAPVFTGSPIADQACLKVHQHAISHAIRHRQDASLALRRAGPACRRRG